MKHNFIVSGVGVCLFFLQSLGFSEVKRYDISAYMDIKVRNRVQEKLEKPAFLLTAKVNITDMAIEMKLVDPVTKSRILRVLKQQTLLAGNSYVLAWDQPIGTYQYNCTIRLVPAGETVKVFTIAFESMTVKPLMILISKEQIDLGKKSLQFTLSRSAQKAELTVYNAQNEPTENITRELGGLKANTPITVEWKGEKEAVSYIKLKAHDIYGFWSEVELRPFCVKIPHEEVNFEFGSYQIQKSEEPKLDKTLKLIQAALKKHGSDFETYLYVAGYTDTVGTREANWQLSEQRARSIAYYFMQKGLQIPIYYQGFGEDVLALKTPDETKCKENRRALYLLTNHLPPLSPEIPKRDWKRLR